MLKSLYRLDAKRTLPTSYAGINAVLAEATQTAVQPPGSLHVAQQQSNDSMALAFPQELVTFKHWALKDLSFSIQSEQHSIQQAELWLTLRATLAERPFAHFYFHKFIAPKLLQSLQRFAQLSELIAKRQLAQPSAPKYFGHMNERIAA